MPSFNPRDRLLGLLREGVPYHHAAPLALGITDRRGQAVFRMQADFDSSRGSLSADDLALSHHQS